MSQPNTTVPKSQIIYSYIIYIIYIPSESHNLLIVHCCFIY
uniref:Uncharacterized protein n=1 Tax=Anguilla anguilla TaxID=7936 RepID=A0A0E9URD5_ANGAN